MIKRVIYVNIVIGILAGSIEAVTIHIPTVSQKRIKHHANHIKTTLKNHLRVERSVECIALLYNLYNLFQIGVSLFYSDDRVLLCKKSDDQAKFIYEQVRLKDIEYAGSWKTKGWKEIPGHAWGSFKDSCGAVWSDFKDLTLLKSFMKVGAQAALMVLTSIGLKSIVKRFSHEQSIDWYVKQYASYSQTITLCLEYIELYGRALKEGAQDDRLYTMVVIMSGLLIQQLEKVIGYMEFYVHSLPVKLRHENRLIEQHLYHYVSDFRNKFQFALQARDLASLQRLLDQCVHQVAYLIKSFSLFEVMMKDQKGMGLKDGVARTDQSARVGRSA